MTTRFQMRSGAMSIQLQPVRARPPIVVQVSSLIRNCGRVVFSCCCALVLGALFISGPAHATWVTVSAGASYSGLVGNDSVGFSDTSVDQLISKTASTVLNGSGGSSTAIAALGVLKTTARSSATMGNISANGNANIGKAGATSTWGDVMTISRSGLTGSGIATVHLQVDGSLFNDGHAGSPDCCLLGSATADTFLRVSSQMLFNFHSEVVLGLNSTVTTTRVNNSVFTGNPYTSWTFLVPFSFGQGLAMDAGLIVSTSDIVGTNSTVNSYADFGNSIYWGGISSIALADGSTTTEFSALGTTGHDWKASAVPQRVSGVPEPASLAIFVIGLAALWSSNILGARRTQRARQAHAVA